MAHRRVTAAAPAEMTDRGTAAATSAATTGMASPPASATASVTAAATATAVTTTAAAVTGLDNIWGHGSRGGCDYCRLSRGGVGHGRRRCGDSYRGSPRRQQRRDIAQSVCHSWAPYVI
jgi:membrane protein involved in colicin uptake